MLYANDISKHHVRIDMIRSSKKNRFAYRVNFSGSDHNYDYICENFSDVIELLEVYDFGGFYYEKES